MNYLALSAKPAYRSIDFLNLFFECKATAEHALLGIKTLSTFFPTSAFEVALWGQVKALYKAFDLGEDFTRDFETGDFLDRRSPEQFSDLDADVQAYVEQSPYELDFRRRFPHPLLTKIRYKNVFCYLLQFTFEVHNLFYFSSRSLETGMISSRYVIHKTSGFFNDDNKVRYQQLLGLLSKMIDPEDRIFEKDELIKKYGFPDVDLQALFSAGNI